MKLPADPKERNQILALVGLVAAGVCVGIFFGFKSLATSKENLRREIEELEANIGKADAKIKRMAVDETDNKAALAEILEISDKFVLPEVLGNYQLPARDILEGYSKDLDLDMDPVRGLGKATVPSSSKGAFGTYTARVSLNCGMHDLVRFLHKLESDNPYLCITGVQITERRNVDKDKPQVSFEVQWPVWNDLEMKTKFEEQMNEEDGSGSGGAQS
jgi:hypothetical protein